MYEYIATQEPLANTRDDFWRLVWEQNTKVIVMLAHTSERVCGRYWPTDDASMKMVDMSLSMMSQVVKKEWTVREFNLFKGSETRTISQFQMTDWPDNGLPQSTGYLVRFTENVGRVIEREPNARPVIVHCSDGSSRSGTFIAIDRLLQHIEHHPFVDIFGIVHELKIHRINMVANQWQYILLHQIVHDVINNVHNIYEEVGEIYVNTIDQPVNDAQRNPASQYDVVI